MKLLKCVSCGEMVKTLYKNVGKDTYICGDCFISFHVYETPTTIHYNDSCVPEGYQEN